MRNDVLVALMGIVEWVVRTGNHELDARTCRGGRCGSHQCGEAGLGRAQRRAARIVTSRLAGRVTVAVTGEA